MRLALGMTFRTLTNELSLRANLGFFLLFAVLILIADRCYELMRIRSEAVTSAISETLDAARIGAERQADVIAGAKAVLRLAVDSPASAADAGASCHDSFRKIVADLPWLRGIWVTDPDGHAICGSSNSIPTASIADRAYFQQATASGTFALSDYIVSRFSQSPGIVAAMPRMRGDAVESVVVLAIEVDWQTQIAAQTGSRHGAEVLLLDSAGTVVAGYPPTDARVGRRIFSDPKLAAALKGPDGTIDSDALDGEHLIISHARLSEMNAVLVVMLPFDSVIAKAGRRARNQIVEILIAAVGSLAVIWIGGERLIMRPIQNLTRGAIRLGSGELGTRIPTEGLAPEFKRLGDSFNDMAVMLRARDAELRRANDRLHELASKDALTDIANRRGFDDCFALECDRARRGGEPLALLAIDVDHFKRFNDCYGHIEGDNCLRRVAGALREAATRAGDFAARTGGEEFALLLPHTDLDAAARMAESVRADIEALNLPHKQSPEERVTVSIGVAAMRGDRDADLASLIKRADAALYRAKHSGRNRVAFEGEEAIPLAS